MRIDIEVISGRILDLLDDKGKLNFYEIKKVINQPDENIVQSLQWLKLTEFISENMSTREYAINDLQNSSKDEGMMVGSSLNN